MDFDCSEEQRAFGDQVDRFARNRLADCVLAWAHAAAFPFDGARKMAEAGLMGLIMDPADGGVGGDLMMAVLTIERIALVCPRSADVFQAGNFGAARALAEFGTDEQKTRFLAPVLAGQSVFRSP